MKLFFYLCPVFMLFFVLIIEILLKILTPNESHVEEELIGVFVFGFGGFIISSLYLFIAMLVGIV